MVSPPALAKFAAPHAPPPGAAGKTRAEHAGSFTFQAISQADRGSVTTKDVFGRFGEKQLRGTVGKSQLVFLIEGENRDVDFLHDGAEKCGRLECSEPLMLERATENVDLGHDVAEWFVAPCGSGADGEITLTQGREQVRHRL